MTGTETETVKSEETQQPEHARFMEKLLNEYDGALAILDEEHHRVVGRDKLIQNIREMCERTNTPQVVLLGKSGTGKTAVVKELKRQCRENHENTEFYKLSIGKMASEGESVLKARIAHIFYKLKQYEDLRRKVEPDFVVFLMIDEFHIIQNIFSGVTKIGGELVKEPLSGGGIRFIAATTHEEFETYIDVDDALSRRLKPLMLQEVGSKELKVILRSWLDSSSSRKGSEESKRISESISDEILDRIITSNAKYRKGEIGEPSKSLDVLESLVGIMKVRKVPASKKIINEIFKTSYNIEIERDIDYEKAVGTIRKQVKGQPLATYIMEDVLLEKIFQFETEGKPVTALLVGPTGVGKTQIVKAFAEGVYGKESAVLSKVDMGNYKSIESVDDFRRETGSILKRNPSSTILFDEIEKAHPDILDVFLSMLDEGVLAYPIVDTAGNKHIKRASLQSANVFGTSNAGAEIFDDLNKYTFFSKELTDYNYNEMTNEMDQFWVKNKVNVLKALKGRRFKPEFINRWQHIVPLFALERATMLEIVENCIVDYRLDLKERYNIDLRVRKAEDWLDRIGQPYTATDIAMFIAVERGSQLDTTAGGARNLQNLIKECLIRPTLRAMRLHPKEKIFYAKASEDSRLAKKSKSKGSGRIEVLTEAEFEQQEEDLQQETAAEKYQKIGVVS